MESLQSSAFEGFPVIQIVPAKNPYFDGDTINRL